MKLLFPLLILLTRKGHNWIMARMNLTITESLQLKLFPPLVIFNPFCLTSETSSRENYQILTLWNCLANHSVHQSLSTLPPHHLRPPCSPSAATLLRFAKSHIYSDSRLLLQSNREHVFLSECGQIAENKNSSCATPQRDTTLDLNSSAAFVLQQHNRSSSTTSSSRPPYPTQFTRLCSLLHTSPTELRKSSLCTSTIYSSLPALLPVIPPPLIT